MKKGYGRSEQVKRETGLVVVSWYQIVRRTLEIGGRFLDFPGLSRAKLAREIMLERKKVLKTANRRVKGGTSLT